MSIYHARRPRGAPRAARGPGRIAVVLALVVLSSVGSGPGVGAQTADFGEDRTLDGSNNNQQNPTWGRANVQYRRVAPARYADGIARPVTGLSPRRVSNRIFNDTAQNLFSENRVSQWGFVWGQFIDHTFGLRATAGGESQNLSFSPQDPLEQFRNDFGAISFTRTPAAPGTGVGNTRQQINTVDSFIDASSVYSNSATRLEWLRQGSVDGNLGNNGASLLLPNGLLPTVAARALAVSGGFAFAISLGEFGATVFIARPDAPTLPVVVFRLLGQPGGVNFGAAMAASTILMALTAVAILSIERVRVADLGSF